MSQNSEDLIYTTQEAWNHAQERISYYEMELQKTRFDEECPKVVE